MLASLDYRQTHSSFRIIIAMSYGAPNFYVLLAMNVCFILTHLAYIGHGKNVIYQTITHSFERARNTCAG